MRFLRYKPMSSAESRKICQEVGCWCVLINIRFIVQQETNSASIYADTTRRCAIAESSTEPWCASNSMMFVCRLLLSRLHSGSLEDEYIASFRCFRKQIHKLSTICNEHIAKVDWCSFLVVEEDCIFILLCWFSAIWMEDRLALKKSQNRCVLGL